MSLRKQPKSIRYVTSDEVIHIHQEILDATGGDSGILSRSNLDFVTDFVKQQVFSLQIRDLFSLAALIARNIIQGHPFVDGNKRAGLEATDLFLRKNGFYLEIEVKEGVEFALAVAKGKMNLEAIQEWLLNHCRKGL